MLILKFINIYSMMCLPSSSWTGRLSKQSRRAVHKRRTPEMGPMVDGREGFRCLFEFGSNPLLGSQSGFSLHNRAKRIQKETQKGENISCEAFHDVLGKVARLAEPRNPCAESGYLYMFCGGVVHRCWLRKWPAGRLAQKGMGWVWPAMVP